VAIVVSAARRRPATAIASLGLLYTINQRFYRLLASRGRRYAFSGVGLHIIHHLTGTASLVVGVLDPALLVAARNGWRRRNGHALMATVDVPKTLHTNGQTFTHAVDELGLEDGLAVTDNDPETRDASVAAA
jgi:hypothetical protein